MGGSDRQVSLHQKDGSRLALLIECADTATSNTSAGASVGGSGGGSLGDGAGASTRGPDSEGFRGVGNTSPVKGPLAASEDAGWVLAISKKTPIDPAEVPQFVCPFNAPMKESQGASINNLY